MNWFILGLLILTYYSPEKIGVVDLFSGELSRVHGR